jgi:hypothetical protein
VAKSPRKAQIPEKIGDSGQPHKRNGSERHTWGGALSEIRSADSNQGVSNLQPTTLLHSVSESSVQGLGVPEQALDDQLQPRVVQVLDVRSWQGVGVPVQAELDQLHKIVPLQEVEDVMSSQGVGVPVPDVLTHEQS